MATLLGAIDAALRIPALFFYDEFLQSRLGFLGVFPSSLLPMHKEADFDFVTGEVNHTLVRDEPRCDSYSTSYFENLTAAHKAVINFNIFAQCLNVGLLDSLGPWLETFVQLVLLTIVLHLSIFFMSLWTKHLLSIYKYLLAVFFVYASYQLNLWIATKKSIFGTSDFEQTTRISFVLQMGRRLFNHVVYFLSTMLVQSVLAVGFTMSREPPSYWLGQLLMLNFAVPSFILMLPIPEYISNRLPFTLSVVPATFLLLELFSSSKNVLRELGSRLEFILLTIRTDGFLTFLNVEWVRLDVGSIFRMFWICRTLLMFAVYVTHPAANFTSEDLNLLQKILLVRSCETLPAVLGLASIFAWLWSKVHQLCQQFLLITGDDESSHVGPVSAILFIIVSLQNGVSNLKPTARLVRLFRSVCLLIACLLHFIHSAVDPVLMSLAASANPVMSRHVRALAVSVALVVFSITGISLLWTTHSVSTWLLAVTGFGIEVISKVLISLALYGLFLCDAKKNEFWAGLDDHIYRVRLVGRAAEFLVGIFLLCNSAFILLFECGGAIRAVLVGLHAYFNLWCEARAGWAVFTRRRDAVRKICSLRTADSTDSPEDVCAICFHELNQLTETIKVTPCKHYFHAVCLRKWLYVQERCPMCHQTLWTQNQKNEPLRQQHEEQRDLADGEIGD